MALIQIDFRKDKPKAVNVRRVAASSPCFLAIARTGMGMAGCSLCKARHSITIGITIFRKGERDENDKIDDPL